MEYTNLLFLEYLINEHFNKFKIGRNNYNIEVTSCMWTRIKGQRAFHVQATASRSRYKLLNVSFKIEFGKRSGQLAFAVINLKQHKKNQKKKYIRIGDDQFIDAEFHRWKLLST